VDLVFDPDAPGSGNLFGLPHTASQAGVFVLPVPIEATTSSAGGTSGAPEAVLTASHQVDLSDPEAGEPWRAGIAMDSAPEWLVAAGRDAINDAERAREGDEDALARVNALGDRIADFVEGWTTKRLQEGQIPAILGGDHSVPLGAIRAAVAQHPGLGILHIDAHADLREAYEGFRHSHASIFYNVLQLKGIDQLVQVGLRDVGRQERSLADADPRVHWWTDGDIGHTLHQGGAFAEMAVEMIAPLPERVWISFDVDGLDPSLCPGTGTPVPGGLSWREAMTLLRTIGTSGRQIVGFDLCEVGVSAWDANVGARLLYKLSGWALATKPEAS
jgi:agmatinase